MGTGLTLSLVFVAYRKHLSNFIILLASQQVRFKVAPQGSQLPTLAKIYWWDLSAIHYCHK